MGEDISNARDSQGIDSLDYLRTPANQQEKVSIPSGKVGEEKEEAIYKTGNRKVKDHTTRGSKY